MSEHTFFLRTLGELSLRRSDQPDEPLLKGSKALMVLALLATMPKRSSRREHIAGLLWPDSSRSRARRSLRQAIFYVSEHAGDSLLISSQGNSTLAIDEDKLSVDLWELDTALKGETYGRVVDLYRGPFLAGMEGKAGVEVEHMIEAENSRIKVGLEVAYKRLISESLSRNDTDAAIERAREFAELNPLDDEAQGTLVRVLRAAGDEVGALGTYQAYRTLLESVLDDTPEEELERSMEKVRHEVLKPPEPRSTEPYQPRPVPVGVGASGGERAQSAPADDASPAPERAPAAAARRSLRLNPFRIDRRLLAASAALAVATTALALTARESGPRVPTTSVERPDGRVLAVLGEGRAQRMGEVVIDEGAVEIRPADGLPLGSLPSPDGQLIAFPQKARDGWNLAVRETGSEEVRTLTRRPGDEFPEAWSPDGRYLLYSRGELIEDGAEIAYELWVLEVGSGLERRLTDLRSRTEISANWSPDGSRIAFVAMLEEEPDVFVVDFDGEGLRNVSESPSWDGDPAWSPDGRTLAFASKRMGGAFVVTVRGDGTEPRRIAGPMPNVRRPVWLSEFVIAFVAGNGKTGDLWVADAATGQSRVVSRRGDIARLISVRRSDRPEWVERVRILPRSGVASPGQHLDLWAGIVDATGDSLLMEDLNVRWTVTRPDVVRPVGAGEFEVVAPGATKIVATVGGWRADTLSLVALPLIERALEPIFQESWTQGLDPASWTRFGRPLSFVRSEGGPADGGAFFNNGDQYFTSGVVSRRSFGTDAGITVESYGRMAFTGKVFQTFTIGFYPDSQNARTEWLDVAPLVEFGISGPAGSQPAHAWVQTPEQRAPVPVPDNVSEWRRYALQIGPGGTVDVIVDGRLHWRSPWRVAIEEGKRVRVGLGSQSFETEVQHGTLHVYTTPRYFLLDVNAGEGGPGDGARVAGEQAFAPLDLARIGPSATVLERLWPASGVLFRWLTPSPSGALLTMRSE